MSCSEFEDPFLEELSQALLSRKRLKARGDVGSERVVGDDGSEELQFWFCRSWVGICVVFVFHPNQLCSAYIRRDAAVGRGEILFRQVGFRLVRNAAAIRSAVIEACIDAADGGDAIRRAMDTVTLASI